MLTTEHFNAYGRDRLPGHLGIVITHVGPREIRAELPVRTVLMAPNGFLHAGTVVTLADTASGYGCVANLPEGATGFTTVELKSNHLGTARQGIIDCVATAVHVGRTTHVWDAVVTHRDTGRTIALFRCTQMILYAAPGRDDTQPSSSATGA
jgi:1,4-dihydroxy-2-naphthoyl-CoA hydrolase